MFNLTNRCRITPDYLGRTDPSAGGRIAYSTSGLRLSQLTGTYKILEAGLARST